ncbi:alpha-amylase family glycosyl hydrolase [Mycoplasmopsis cricetuli]|uniref:alpha-amylase family glycosyl hydrolase n=1 Tax=Mycoplasmopsis cricetuli TaxID=171283 RepID=UPI00046E7170|nr:alpha-amylase family glycosyl hydrolase [Mycoplasmopsis cricetuli]
MIIKFLKFLLPSFILVPVLLVTSCKQKNKNVQKWGDTKFSEYILKNSLINLDYVQNSLNTNNVAPFEKKVNSQTIYQLTVYSFADGNNDGIGDFIGLKNNLHYFIDLGINTLYLSPIHPASSYHGYDVIDYLDVAPELGGKNAFLDFLKHAHKNGIKVILDLVFNHTSYEHPWFQAALAGDKKYQDYYYFLDLSIPDNTAGLGIDDDHSRRHFLNLKSRQSTSKKYVAEFWKGMPDLNLNNPKVIEQLKAVQRYWSKLGVDGFRYDAFYHFFDSKNPYKPKTNGLNKTNEFFRQLRKVNKEVLNDGTIRSSNEPFLFGEWWKSPQEAQLYIKKNNLGLDSVIDGFHWKDQISVSIEHEQEKQLLEYLNKNNSTWMPFLDNHDVQRWINQFKIKVKNLSNSVFNDQKLTEVDKTIIEYGLTSLLSRPGSPILYNGIELNLHGGPQQKGDNLIREAFPWSDKDKRVDFYEKRSGEKFSRIYLNLSKNEQTIENAIKDPNSTYNLVKKLNWIRNEYPYVISQNLNTIVDIKELVENLDNIDFSKFNVRTNGKGEYLLYIFDWNKIDFKVKLKNSYQIIDTLISKNIKICDDKNSFLGNGIGAIGVFKIINLTSQNWSKKIWNNASRKK